MAEHTPPDSAATPTVFRTGDALIVLASGLGCAAAVAAATLGATGSADALPQAPAWPMLIAIGVLAFAAGAQLPLLARLSLRLRRERAEARRIAAARSADRALFHDLQHHVANAMQFASSLLSLAAARVRDRGDAEAALEDAAGRLAAMAVIHRRLHDPALGDGRLGETLATLARDLLAARGRQDIALSVSVADDVPALGLTRISAVASIVVEAVTNAVKHAFDGRHGGRLAIALRSEGCGLTLSIVDDGPGPPSEPPDPTSLGLAVMGAMAARLGGRFTLDAASGGGAAVRVTFPRT